MQKISSSFRDPFGFLYTHNGTLYRQINKEGRLAYDQLIASGLSEKLIRKNWLIGHHEVYQSPFDETNSYRVIEPELIPFISYPYEWSFSQLKDAALLTLDIQLLAIRHGMVLRDASAYNIQFKQGKPVLIDTLSLGPYDEGKSWEAYRQFCQHFLAPLLLMSKRDIRLNNLSKVWMDGVPLDLASSLLPVATWFSPHILMHVHLHAKAQKAYAGSGNISNSRRVSQRPLSRNGLLGIVSGLRGLIDSLDWKPIGTEWSDYYQNTNYSEDAFGQKSKIIEDYLDEIQPKSVWDLGANTGVFSRLASRRGIPTVAFDIDPAAVEMNYRKLRGANERDLLPLVMDLANPSSAIGWGSEERSSLISRSPSDCVLALALIHHLAISNNVPLEKIAAFMASICSNLIIEFVPKSDSQVARLLSSRVDIFHDYHEQGFEDAFGKEFVICKKTPVTGSQRILYRLSKRL